ncbi:hypothetical protein [Roseovarius tolerans]|uniref:hypothetical protein n=1 Tax=Roseovarius tolerans TaxID=74031 RepID=UPI0009439ABA|nr:hypothetical protein [Roseovarius tolerans]
MVTLTGLVWEGVTVNIVYSKEKWHSPFHHLEIKAAAPLPITETGYRSHFVAPEEIEVFGSPKAFVEEWIAHAAKDPKWVRQAEAARQGELF